MFLQCIGCVSFAVPISYPIAALLHRIVSTVSVLRLSVRVLIRVVRVLMYLTPTMSVTPGPTFMTPRWEKRVFRRQCPSPRFRYDSSGKVTLFPVIMRVPVSLIADIFTFVIEVLRGG